MDNVQIVSAETQYKFKFPAGTYYIGDPCYMIDDDDWQEIGDKTGWFGAGNEPFINYNGLFELKGRTCFAEGTHWGDGVYSDNKGNQYGVDAGLIGLVPLDVCKSDDLPRMLEELGAVHEFKTPFEVYQKDGYFHFGDVIVNTVGEPSDGYLDDPEDDEDDSDF